MPEKKRVVQDIVPSGKRTIRSIPPRVAPPRHVEVEERGGEVVEEVPIRRAPPTISIRRAETRFETPPPPPRRREPPPPRASSVNPTGKRRRIPGILLTFGVIFVCIAIIAVALSLLYSKAAVTITPKVAHIDVNGTFTAKKTGDTSTGSSLLTYDTITAAETVSQTVPATDGPQIDTKAKGSVTLYNEQTTQQKIVAGTRLSNSEGKIYRTSATVVIPLGKPGAPGTVVAAVLADQAGAEYNMSLAGSEAFTIVAYKGTPKYDTVYAKLKTAITGGFSGKKTTISADVEKATLASLKESATAKLLDDAKKQVPAGSVLYPNAYTIDVETPEPVSKGDSTAEITLKATFTGAVFNKAQLLKSIAAKELDKFPAPTYDIEKMEALNFTVVNSKDFMPRKGSPLIFTLKGPVDLMGTFSEEALKNELKGTYLKDSNSIFAHYPSIANAYALITPFWMRSFPNSADKIIIEVKK